VSQKKEACYTIALPLTQKNDIASGTTLNIRIPKNRFGLKVAIFVVVAASLLLDGGMVLLSGMHNTASFPMALNTGTHLHVGNRSSTQ
jgi:hypothetical protein